MNLLFPDWKILFAAFILDIIMGDPKGLPHPIRWMGHAISAAEPRFRSLPFHPILNGGAFAVTLIAGTYLLSVMVVLLAGWIHPTCRLIIEIIGIYYCISIRSLEESAMKVYWALRHRAVDHARTYLAHIVGRDVRPLSEQGIARAAVETVAENLVDGVISPLFFAFIGGAPLALTYKMVNTLDSMVGYKNKTYIHFGKISARIDDVANFIPARLSIFIIAISAQLCNKKGIAALLTALREGKNHSSPNSGYSEAAFAGTLEIKLGGPNIYHGMLVEKPYIGVNFGETNAEHIKKACDIMLLASVIWTIMLMLL